jgi:hypothetical protein
LFGDNKNPHVEHHLLILSRSWCILFFIDFQKAFDMLWKHGLLQKMVSLNIYMYGNMLSYVNGFLSNRTLQVRINNTCSDIYIVQNGFHSFWYRMIDH